jgi:hypothetical protein
MTKIYIPSEILSQAYSFNGRPCVSIISGSDYYYYRVVVSTTDWYYVYPDAHYSYIHNQTQVSSYSNTLCMVGAPLYSDLEATDNVLYRQDLPEILLTFTILCIFCFLIPLKIFVRLFRRFQ